MVKGIGYVIKQALDSTLLQNVHGRNHIYIIIYKLFLPFYLIQ